MPKAFNQVRIIGGKFRGKKINFAPILGLRPTPDRVRETLFNWLALDIHGADCLDAFAGSGALGFEAISRGANFVTMLDQSPDVVSCLNNYKQQLVLQNLEIFQVNALEHLSHSTKIYDIIFLDPPYNSGLVIPIINLIDKFKLLRNSGLIYVENATPLNPAELPNHWELLKQKKAGQVYYSLYRVDPANKP